MIFAIFGAKKSFGFGLGEGLIGVGPQEYMEFVKLLGVGCRWRWGGLQVAGETREWFQEIDKEVRGGTLYPFFLMRRLQRIFCQELDFQTVEIRLGFVNSVSLSVGTGRSSGVFPTPDRLQ
jgi:hypothetical protein